MRGRDAAEGLRAEPPVYTGLSVEMLRSSVKGRNIGGVFHITSAKLVAAGLVDLAEYPGSTVSVRQAIAGDVDPLELLLCL